ncbi:replication-associated recombination protein A [Candidatus Fermentibacteria bacterium]|nr:replication-associated recombination protein A [Candidatus Fermentibacteria bacterium]
MEQLDLFELDIAETPPADAPLAHRMRPVNLDEVVGQGHLLLPGAAFRRALEEDTLGSVILWGPPGCGKTSLASVVARYTSKRFLAFSAVTSGLPELRIVVSQARHALARSGRRTILFVDEIHRFNKTQQDGLLPHVEDGTLQLIGATTENPSFQLVGPLLSRCTVYPLKRLESEDVLVVIRRALVHTERGLGLDATGWSDAALVLIAELADGDLRKGLNLLEAVAATNRSGEAVTPASVREVAGQQALLYDKGGEEHYNIISALHKCIRDSDVDSALYWLARMVESGEDPLYIARRLIRVASEDIGTAHPQALPVAVAAMHTVQLLGLPEADCALAQAVVYLALAPKSNAVYTALTAARGDARTMGSLPVPMVLRNAPTRLMDDLGYGKGYVYAHDDPHAASAQQHWPDGMKPRRYYRPRSVGWEGKLQLGEKPEARNPKSETSDRVGKSGTPDGVGKSKTQKRE